MPPTRDLYQPATERQSHYYHVRPSDQFDAMIHIEHTHALEPLEMTSQWKAGETPETYRPLRSWEHDENPGSSNGDQVMIVTLTMNLDPARR